MQNFFPVPIHPPGYATELNTGGVDYYFHEIAYKT